MARSCSQGAEGLGGRPGASEGRNHGVPGEGGLSFYHWAAVEGRRRDGLVEVSGMLL